MLLHKWNALKSEVSSWPLSVMRSQQTLFGYRHYAKNPVTPKEPNNCSSKLRQLQRSAGIPAFQQSSLLSSVSGSTLGTILIFLHFHRQLTGIEDEKKRRRCVIIMATCFYFSKFSSQFNVHYQKRPNFSLLHILQITYKKGQTGTL